LDGKNAENSVSDQGDAVLDGSTFVLIVEAEDKEYIQNFMRPFAQAGSVEILASTCEAVVERWVVIRSA
jgi:hypothetical protein